MAVTFVLPSERPHGLVSFAWSPLLETALSWRAVVRPKRYPMHLPWARRCRDLPASLRHEIQVLTGGLHTFLPGIFEVGLRGESPSFEDELDEFHRLDEIDVLYEVSLGYGGLGCAPCDHDRSIVHDPAYADEVVAGATAADPAFGATVRTAFDDPAAFRDRLGAMAAQYWELAFRDEWDRIRPRIEAEVTDGARTLVTAGMPALVADFLPEGRWEPDGPSIVVDKRKYEATCDVAERGGLLLVPTVYGWPNVLIELNTPWPLSIFFPLRDMREPAVPHATDHEVADGLRALGDETRLQITRLVAEQPRSTKELAALLSLSESAVSRHLKILAGSGVVDGERDGYFVLYRLVPDRIGALGGALRRTLGLAQANTGQVPKLPVSVARSDES